MSIKLCQMAYPSNSYNSSLPLRHTLHVPANILSEDAYVTILPSVSRKALGFVPPMPMQGTVAKSPSLR
jgi:hypothetical protein